MTETNNQPRIHVEPSLEQEWPGASALATACVLNLAWLLDRMDAYSTTLAQEHGIPSIPAFNVLAILRGAGQPLSPTTIAQRMVITRATMTGILHSLERRELIQRVSNPEDRRQRLVEITPEGLRRVERFLPQLHQAEKRLMNRLSETEQQSLLHTVAVLQGHSFGD